MKWLYGAGAIAWACLAVAKVGEGMGVWPAVDLPICTPFAFTVCAIWQFNLAVHE